jgi:LPS-assembly protein
MNSIPASGDEEKYQVRAAKIISLTVLLSASALADPPVSTDIRGISCWPEFEEAPLIVPDSDDDPIEFTSGEADITGEGDASFRGPIVMQSGKVSLTAQSATYDKETETFSIEGNVSYQDQETRVSGKSVQYNTESGVFSFNDAEYELQKAPARGSAGALIIEREGRVKLQDVRYTSCPVGNDDWILKAKSIEVDDNTGMGTVRSASLSFKGVPFLYIPYITVPVNDERKSGLLFPKIGTSDRRGFEFWQPIYWNIAPNYDATIVPRYMSKRGLQLGTELRFLTENNSNGEIWGDFLSDDDRIKEDRWQFDVETESFLSHGWRASVLAVGVSDNAYYDDFSSRLSTTSQTSLNRSIDFERYSEHWSMMVRLQDFQTIDPKIDLDQEPYAQLPQIVANGRWRDGFLGLDYSLDTETSYFYRDDSVKGARLHLKPAISLPLEGPGLYFVPEIAVDYTGYKLTDLPDDEEETPSRSAPIFSIDTGAIFDKTAGDDDQWLVTLEPRAQYTYIPFRDQSDIPIFDTIQPDFNLIQLFRQNRYIGHDRIGDTRQLSWGLTSRMLSAENGSEILTATIGQTRFFDTGDVTLPGEDPSSDSSSDYIAELEVNVWDNWNIDIRHQWDSDTDRTERSSVRVQYKPGEFKAVNMVYRYVDGSLEQTDLSFAWPVGESWNLIGRYNYSLLEEKALDRFVGIEYESCCWAINLLARRSVSRTTGERDSTVSIQFILKGFSSLGSEATIGLRDDIMEGRRY